MSTPIAKAHGNTVLIISGDHLIELKDTTQIAKHFNTMFSMLSDAAIVQKSITEDTPPVHVVDSAVEGLFASVHPELAKPMIATMRHVHPDAQADVATAMISGIAKHVGKTAAIISDTSIDNDLYAKQLHNRVSQINGDMTALAMTARKPKLDRQQRSLVQATEILRDDVMNQRNALNQAIIAVGDAEIVKDAKHMAEVLQQAQAILAKDAA